MSSSARAARPVRLRLALLGVLAATAVGAVGWEHPAGAAARRPDLAVTNMVPDVSYPAVGETVYTRTDLRNRGTADSGPVSLTVTLPPQLQPATPAGTFPVAEWQCSFAAPTWTCTRAGLAVGAFTTLSLPATVASGAPDDVLTLTAHVAPSRRETLLDNNTYQVSVTIAGTGTIRGTIWSDLDRDGQREPGEPPVGSGPDGVQRLLLIPRNAAESGGNPIEVTVAPDGTYGATVKSGLYTVQVWVSATHYYFTTPNVGDDATDSDLVDVFGDNEVSTGNSDLISVLDGSEHVVDGGLFDRTLG